MVQVSEIGLKDDEVELDLGLSIGGSFQRSDKAVHPDHPKPNAFQLHHLKHHPQAWEGSFKDANPDSATMPVVDPQTKREIHALRRLEAKRKRDEKQQHKRLVREFEPEHQQPPSKREKTDPHRHAAGGGGSEWPNVNLNVNGSTVSFHQPYAFVQLNNNGYAYPCVVPLMAPCVEDKNAGQPAVACKGFRPFSGNGYGSDPNGERDCGDNKKAKSDGSSMCSSSVVSDYQSSSQEGGGSSESQSQSRSVQSKENSIRSQAEQSASSDHSMRSEQVNGQSSTNHTVTQPHDQTKLNHLEQSTMDNKAVQGQADKKKTTLSNDKKPPKPLPQTSSLSPALSKMPYVSTTGDGPNGKRVNGFLYRYSNAEVSIVCVCHGSTFSPAGFVQHAGGTDTSHPERNITVIPSAFG